jgi:DnaD/phage-associated family protein
MTWVKIDDLLPDHPKVRRAGPAAAWLYIAGLCYCSRYLTDGFIADAALPWMGQYSKGRARTLAAKLVEVGLWERVDGGYQVHDYLQWNRSKAETKQQREAARVRMNKRRSSPEATHPCSPELPTSTSTSEQDTGTTKQKGTNVGTEGEEGSSPEHSANIFRLYEQTIGPFDPHMATKLTEAEGEYSQECIRHSFQEASENNARSWRYVEAILKAHKANGCYAARRPKSEAEANEVLERHERQQSTKGR